jgi:valyl-tRNA synthetase
MREYHGCLFPREGEFLPACKYSANQQIPEQDFPEASADFDLTNDTIRAARSIVGLYNLPTNGKTVEDKITLIIQSKKAEIADMLQKQTDIIVALTKGCGTCKFITSDSEVPQGCGSEVVTTDVTVHIPVQVRPPILTIYSKADEKGTS